MVIKLKAYGFETGFIIQVNMTQNIVNDVLCHLDDQLTITRLLVKGKNKTVVKYSLAGYQKPIGVAEWKNQIAKALPEELRSSLPPIYRRKIWLEFNPTAKAKLRLSDIRITTSTAC